MRSAGITDLRHGYVLEEDWKGHDRFANRADSRRPLPLPKRVQCYAIAAALGHAPASRRDQVIGDGLVPLPSALGEHPDSRLKLAFPAIAPVDGQGHDDMGLLLPGRVYERIRNWFGE